MNFMDMLNYLALMMGYVTLGVLLGIVIIGGKICIRTGKEYREFCKKECPYYDKK